MVGRSGMVRRLIFMLALLAFPASASTYLDVCLQFTSTKAKALTALQTLGLTKEMLSRDDLGNFQITTANHHVTVDLWMRPVLQFGIYDADGNEITPPVFASAPILRIRFISDSVKSKARGKIANAGKIPAGLQKVPCPTTRIWAGD